MLAKLEPPPSTDSPFTFDDQHFGLSVSVIKKRINDWLYDKMNGVVQSGPFIGMKLGCDETWKDGSLGNKILGCYEQELHHCIEYEIQRLEQLIRPKIVNIGSAEGYYAVGFAGRLRNAEVWVIDTDEALEVSGEAARANGVRLWAGTLDQVLSKPDLVICDCEGAETGYLDKTRFPDLAKANIIVECHDFSDRPTTQVIADRFTNTHCVMQVLSGARNPAQFEFMQKWHQTVQWIAMDEGRPCTMRWLIMRPLPRG